jgi:hypothetical protein
MRMASKLIIAIAAGISAIPAASPALAFPAVQKIEGLQPDVEQIQYREHRWDRHRYRHGWYGGHRGYRDYRRGYRRHSDGWWYPLAAFGAGAVIGGAIANSRQPEPPPVRYGVDPRHHDWCAARFRTYRASDNTYVPYVGGLAECRSPYY